MELAQHVINDSSNFVGEGWFMAVDQIVRHRAVDLIVSFPDAEMAFGPNRTARWLSESGALALRFLHFPQAIIERASRLVLIVQPSSGHIEAVLRGRLAASVRALGAGVSNSHDNVLYGILLETSILVEGLRLSRG